MNSPTRKALLGALILPQLERATRAGEHYFFVEFDSHQVPEFAGDWWADVDAVIDEGIQAAGWHVEATQSDVHQIHDDDLLYIVKVDATRGTTSP